MLLFIMLYMCSLSVVMLETVPLFVRTLVHLHVQFLYEYLHFIHPENEGVILVSGIVTR